MNGGDLLPSRMEYLGWVALEMVAFSQPCWSYKNLIDQAKPGSHISEVLRCGELCDGPRYFLHGWQCCLLFQSLQILHHLLQGWIFLGSGLCHFFHICQANFLLRKKQSLMISAYSKDIIDAFGFGLKCCGNLIIHSGESNSRGYVALWGCAILITPLWCDESCVVAVIGVERALWYPLHVSNTSTCQIFWPRGTYLLGGKVTGWDWFLWLYECWLAGNRWSFFVVFFIFLAQITIWWHQVTGSPIGTCSSIPSQTSLSIPAFTSSCQWMGTGTGEWYAESSVFGSIINLIGGPSIMGSGWCSHVLRMLEL